MCVLPTYLIIFKIIFYFCENVKIFRLCFKRQVLCFTHTTKIFSGEAMLYKTYFKIIVGKCVGYVENKTGNALMIV